MKCLVLDNYDSFTYNLVYLINQLGLKTEVRRNDKISLAEIQAYDKIILSPGPGIPDDAGILKDLIKTYAATKSIFGVCLGHQAISEVFGATLFNMDKVYHGVKTNIHITKRDYIFDGLPDKFNAGRYHSWAVGDQLPKEIEKIAEDENGQIMAARHTQYDVRGVQFHPESIMTESGRQIIQNFLYH